ncbi:hypothetical protein Lal_00004054 [Lupinus albus]|uniref:Putative ATPase, AAA-type, core, AAA-type ATPase domain-containing protein n=1 Tax=Lupinus albus TaxID=3870 RepID=A0A6A5P938_LUPAL|nr:putative ATPase, AAA-type, core, AAA-type ATPase domain-containing protein [Lupinus albus]KAF1894135.1 hypothetical protein Lal_00004054 [Lupinus albus]
MLLYKLIFLIILILFLLFLLRIFLFKTGLIYTVNKLWRITLDWCHVYQFLTIPELQNETFHHNPLYTKVSLYLHTLSSIEDSDFTNLVTGNNQNDIVLTLNPNQIIEDHFLGATVFWFNDSNPRAFVLKIRKEDKRRILRPYLHYIHTVSDEIEEEGKRDLRLFMIDGGDRNQRWRSVPFTHPSTFETMAMETDLKNRVKSDLESFLKSKQHYNRLGRVWKRSFLLYGPSGTGKSSFVAAMANFLKYDVYDIDLFRIQTDSNLKSLLLQTKPKSIIVIEDLDQFLQENEKRATKTSLSSSSLLNFMDGVVSCEEIVMVFTMRTKENIDPNFLRPGRVDIHIYFPLCNFSTFKTMANNYLGVKEHKLFPQVEEIFGKGTSLSQAEISELMIVNRNSPSRAIKSIINVLQMDGDGRRSILIGRQGENDEKDENDDGISDSVFSLKNSRGGFSSSNNSLASTFR